MPNASESARAWWPRCLRHRAQFRYEVLGEDGMRVPLTLAGYRLRPGRTYALTVRAVGKEKPDWSLDPLLGSRLVEWGTVGPLVEDERRVTFRTRGGLRGSLFQFFRPPTAELKLRIVTDEAPRPRQIRIPLCISGRWLYLPALLVVSVGWILLRFISFEAMLIGGGALVVGTVLLFVWDRWRIARRARELTEEVAETPFRA